ncbi:hypothetical protein AMST5_04082 [freshwater sediment metagenome]|uniref:Helix-turn-helix domain-containing protein n=1 Tax=freshwater sediment metagenome TaxID=556182 RepID=A0AA48RF61_9ZZZZ
MAVPKKLEAYPVADRLIEGAFVDIEELCSIKKISKSVVYLDIKEGLLPVVKFGRATRIAGQIAKAYIPRVGVKAA